MLVVIVVKIVLTFAVSVAVGYVLSQVERHPMAWYAHTWPVFMYLALVSAVQLTVTAVTRKSIFRNVSASRLEAVHFDAFQLFAMLVTVIFTVFQLGSAYLPMFYCLGAFLFRNLVYERIILPSYRRSKLEPNESEVPLGVLLAINAASYALAMAQSAYMNVGMAGLLIPILGRAGSEPNAEVVFACMVSFFSIWSLLSQCSILYFARVDRALAVCGAVVAGVFALLCFTELGFPFHAHAHTEDVYLKRVFMSHTVRVISHDEQLVENRTYLWVTPLDPEGVELIHEYMKASQVDVDKRIVLDCESEYWPYCGLPLIYPVATMIKRQYLYPIPEDFYPRRHLPELRLLETVALPAVAGKASVRLIFECLHIPSHMSLIVANRLGVEFVRWTFWTTELPEAYESLKPAYATVAKDQVSGTVYTRQHYFVYYSYGTPPLEPFRVAADFVLSNDLHGKVPLAEIALGATYMHKPESETQLQKNLRHTLPEWVNDVIWATHYDAKTYYASVN